MANVTVIPAKINPLTRQSVTAVQKRRVAGYARVSTDSDEQFTSYTAQIDYYTNYIKSHSGWEFVKVYTDEGITGTNTKHRAGFNEMIDDALGGKIDLIVTKSVSRFARNTVDTLVAIRQLKEVGCECFFEKENIYTFDGKGELLLTIMSSLAQEESRSISENVTWGQRKRFADGKVSMPYKRFLGYEKGENGPVVNQEQAEIVRLIYSLFLQGKTQRAIAMELESRGIPSPGGKKKWTATTITSILTNEKYKGDALLQKKFTVDFLTKTTKVNEGEVPQYYVTGSHEGIIDPVEFDLAQAEMARRKQAGASYSGKSVLSSRLICSDCGSIYGRKVWHSTDRFRKEIWQCNHKFTGSNRCTTPTMEEPEIKRMFLAAFNDLQGKTLLEDIRLMYELLTDYTELDRQISEVADEMTIVAGMVSNMIKENAIRVQAQSDYEYRYQTLEAKYKADEEHLRQLQAERSQREQRELELKVFLQCLEETQAPHTEWSDELWLTSIRQGTVFPDGSIEFEFKDGQKIKVEA